MERINQLSQLISSSKKPSEQLPLPATTGFKFPNSVFKYPLIGQWDKQSAFIYKLFTSILDPNQPFKNLTHFRKAIEKGLRMSFENPKNQSYIDQVSIQELVIDPSKFCQENDSKSLKICIYKKKESKPQNQTPNSPAMIYFHGGGAIALSVSHYHSICARYAIDNNLTVFSVDYRLAPEHKAPSGILDAYSSVKYV